VDFLAMLRRMPHLVQLSIDGTLPSSARDFLSNGELEAIPMISLPHLSNVSITMTPLSTITVLLSCIDIPLKAQVQLEAWYEFDDEDDVSTLDDYIQLASLLGQRISQSGFRSLTIGSQSRIALAFSTSERVECYSPDSLFFVRSDENAHLKVLFVADPPMYEIDCPVLSGIRSVIPLANIESVHFLGTTSLEPEFWTDILGSLSDVRHIRFSHEDMPNITSALSLPSQHLTRSWKDHCADSSQGEIFVPKLEELELYQTILNDVRAGQSPDPYVADLHDLYDAIATRKETRCRLTIEECRLMTGMMLCKVGWWEGTEFKVTSKF